MYITACNVLQTVARPLKRKTTVAWGGQSPLAAVFVQSYNAAIRRLCTKLPACHSFRSLSVYGGVCCRLRCVWRAQATKVCRNMSFGSVRFGAVLPTNMTTI